MTKEEAKITLAKLKRYMSGGGVVDKSVNKAIDMAIEALSQPEPHWIPVTERLPENGRQVLVYARSMHYALAKYDEMREADGTYKKQWVTFDAWKPLYTIKEVITWCELPNCPNLTRG